MNNDEMQKEIERLRLELDALKVARGAGNEAQGAGNEAQGAGNEAQGERGAGPAFSKAETVVRGMVENLDMEALVDRLKEASTRAEKELRAVNPLALIAVFVLGFIFGRLLSK